MRGTMADPFDIQLYCKSSVLRRFNASSPASEHTHIADMNSTEYMQYTYVVLTLEGFNTVVTQNDNCQMCVLKQPRNF